MIVKNEAENLARCLQSVHGVVDEIVVVDTGSEDDTKEIARRFGARVLDYPWGGDFSAARNFSLEHATGDWVLILDADEELAGEGHNDLRSFLAEAEHEAYLVLETNYVGETPGADAVLSVAPRIFRNRPYYRYSGAIHEQIGPAIREHGGTIGVSGVRLNHYGYLRSVVADRRKIERNLNILRAEARRRPADPFVRFNLGVEYLRLNDYGRALEQFRASFSRLPGLQVGYAPFLVRNIAWCLKQLRRFKEALKVLEDAIPAYPDYTDLLFLKGAVYADMQRYSEAVEAFEMCVKRGEFGLLHTTEQGVGGYKAFHALGQVYERLGDIPRAVRAYTEALDGNRRFLPALDALADALLPREPLEEVRAFFARHLDLRDEDTLAALGSAFARNGKYQEALEYLDQGLAQFPASARLAFLKGIVLLFLNRYEEAREWLGRVPEHSRFVAPARANLAFAHYLLGNLNAAQDVLLPLHGVLDTPELAVVEALVLLEAGNPPGPVLARLAEHNLPEVDAQVLRLLGQLVKLGEYEKFERALPLLQVFPEGERSLHLGKLYFSCGFFDLAAEELLKVARQETADAECMCMLGDICMNKELYEDAEVFYRAAVAKDSKTMRHYTALTASLVRQQKFGEGAAVLEEAIRRFPQSELLRATLQAVRALARN